jgi:hypothetical protein
LNHWGEAKKKRRNLRYLKERDAESGVPFLWLCWT